MRRIEVVHLARLLSVDAVVSTPTRRAAIHFAHLIAWVALIREAGVATIGARFHGTLAVGAVVIVVVTMTYIVATFERRRMYDSAGASERIVCVDCNVFTIAFVSQMATKTTVGSDDVIIRIIGAIIFFVRSYFYTVNLSDNARAQLGCYVLLTSIRIDVGTCTAAVIFLGI
jgi:hypothetical protein